MNATPAVAFVGQDTVTASGCAKMVTLADPEALAVLASVTVNDSVFVPFEASVLMNVPVPLYGVLPPVADTVQINGLPIVTPIVGHKTVTVKG